MKRFIAILTVMLLALPAEAKTPESETPVVLELHVRNLMQFSMDVAKLANEFDKNAGLMVTAGISGGITSQTGIANIDMKKPVSCFLINPDLVGDDEPVFAIVMSVTDVEEAKKAPMGAGQALHVLDGNRILAGIDKAVALVKKEEGLLAAAEARKMTTDIEVVVHARQLFKNASDEIKELSEELNVVKVTRKFEGDADFASTGLDAAMCAKALCNLGRSGLNSLNQMKDFTFKLDITKDDIVFSGGVDAVGGTKLADMIGAFRAPVGKMDAISKYLPKGEMISYSETRVDLEKLDPIHSWILTHIKALGTTKETARWVDLYNKLKSLGSRQQVAAQYDLGGQHQIMLYEVNAKGAADFVTLTNEMLSTIKKPFMSAMDEVGLKVEISSESFVHRDVKVGSIEFSFVKEETEETKKMMEMLRNIYGTGVHLAVHKNIAIMATGKKSKDHIKAVIDRIIDNKTVVKFAKDRGANAKRGPNVITYAEYSLMGALRMQSEMMGSVLPPEDNPIEQMLAAIDMEMNGPEEPMRLYVSGDGKQLSGDMVVPIKTVVALVKGVQAVVMRGFRRGIQEIEPINPDLDDF